MELNFGQQPNSSSVLEPEPHYGNTINIDFSNNSFDFSGPTSFTAEMREAIYMEASMQPLLVVDEESLRAPPKMKSERLSMDPKSVVSRERRERIAHKLRVLGRLVPGGTEMSTASMLEEAWHYTRFLERQVQLLQALQVYQEMIMDDGQL